MKINTNILSERVKEIFSLSFDTKTFQGKIYWEQYGIRYFIRVIYLTDVKDCLFSSIENLPTDVSEDIRKMICDFYSKL